MFSKRKNQPAEAEEADGNGLAKAIASVCPLVDAKFDIATAQKLPRRDLASEVRIIAVQGLKQNGITLNRLEQRQLITALINHVLATPDGVPQNEGQAAQPNQADVAGNPIPESVPNQGTPDSVVPEAAPAVESPAMADPPPPLPSEPVPTGPVLVAEEPSQEASSEMAPESSPNMAPDEEPVPSDSTELVHSEDVARTLAELGAGLDQDFDTTAFVTTPIDEAKARVQPVLLERIDIAAATEMPRADLARQVTEIVSEILFEERLRLNLAEQRDLVTMLINDMLGLGPLEPLLSDETITDIMVNGPNQVYVERKGKLDLTTVRFRDNAHVLNIATRIVSKIGRRIDESQPLVDARLAHFPINRGHIRQLRSNFHILFA